MISEDINAQWICGDPWVFNFGMNPENNLCFGIKPDEEFIVLWEDQGENSKN